jgi:hypothetical protein
LKQFTEKQLLKLHKNAMKIAASGWYCSTPPITMNLWVCTIGGGILVYAQFPDPLLLMVL